jgi:hypothetical protein
MCSGTRSLALGLVRLPPHTSIPLRTVLRVSVAVQAADKGYALAEILEVDGDTGKDDAAYQLLEELAERLDAQAVVVAGLVDLARVEQVAEQARFMVVETILPDLGSP